MLVLRVRTGWAAADDATSARADKRSAARAGARPRVNKLRIRRRCYGRFRWETGGFGAPTRFPTAVAGGLRVPAGSPGRLVPEGEGNAPWLPAPLGGTLAARVCSSAWPRMEAATAGGRPV